MWFLFHFVKKIMKWDVYDHIVARYVNKLLYRCTPFCVLMWYNDTLHDSEITSMIWFQCNDIYWAGCFEFSRLTIQLRLLSVGVDNAINMSGTYYALRQMYIHNWINIYTFAENVLCISLQRVAGYSQRIEPWALRTHHSYSSCTIFAMHIEACGKFIVSDWKLLEIGIHKSNRLRDKWEQPLDILLIHSNNLL